LLGKINYLRRFIANLVGKVDSFLPLVRTKHEGEFRWGEEEKEAFEKIKKYLTSPPILRAPRANQEFRLYVVAREHMIGVVLTKNITVKNFWWHISVGDWLVLRAGLFSLRNCACPYTTPIPSSEGICS
jgi:hypothetical protein